MFILFLAQLCKSSRHAMMGFHILCRMLLVLCCSLDERQLILIFSRILALMNNMLSCCALYLALLWSTEIMCLALFWYVVVHGMGRSWGHRRHRSSALIRSVYHGVKAVQEVCKGYESWQSSQARLLRSPSTMTITEVGKFLVIDAETLVHSAVLSLGIQYVAYRQAARCISLEVWYANGHADRREKQTVSWIYPPTQAIAWSEKSPEICQAQCGQHSESIGFPRNKREAPPNASLFQCSFYSDADEAGPYRRMLMISCIPDPLSLAAVFVE